MIMMCFDQEIVVGWELSQELKDREIRGPAAMGT